MVADVLDSRLRGSDGENWSPFFQDAALGEYHSPGMVRSRFLIILLPTAALAGLYVPTQALLVNRAKRSEVDVKANGLVAHIRDTGFDVGVQVDLKRVGDEEKFRISLDPRPSDPAHPGKIPSGTSVVFQQLPPGVYVASKISLGAKDPIPFKPDTFVVRPGQILSLGKVRVQPELDMLGFMEKLEVRTTVWAIDSAIKAVHAYGIDTLPVISKQLRWEIEKK